MPTPARRAPDRPDDAVSEVVATIIGVVVVVALALGVWVMLGLANPHMPDLQIVALQGDTYNGSLVVQPVSGLAVPWSSGAFILSRDGAPERVMPLSLFRGAMNASDMWTAGNALCIVGPGKNCTFPDANQVRLKLVAGDFLIVDKVYRLRPFRILPTGGVSSFCGGGVGVTVVGSEITKGPNGPPIPVFANFTFDGGKTLTPLFGGKKVKAGMNATFDVPPGAVLGLRGTADGHGFRASYLSYDSDPHVRVLAHGAPVPGVRGYAGQKNVSEYLAPFVDPSKNTIRLSYNEVIVLYEFNRDLKVAAADFQDLVVLFSFPPVGCAL